MSAKEFAQRVLRSLPDDASIDDVHYTLYVADLLERRGQAVDEVLSNGVDAAMRDGKILAHDDVVQRMSRWLRK